MPNQEATAISWHFPSGLAKAYSMAYLILYEDFCSGFLCHFLPMNKNSLD